MRHGFRARVTPTAAASRLLWDRHRELQHERITVMKVGDVICMSADAYEKLKQMVAPSAELLGVSPALNGTRIVVSPLLPFWRKRLKPSRQRHIERRQARRKAEAEARADPIPPFTRPPMVLAVPRVWDWWRWAPIP